MLPGVRAGAPLQVSRRVRILNHLVFMALLAAVILAGIRLMAQDEPNPSMI